MTASPPRLRGYRIDGLLGAGAQASVWRAVPWRGEAVALKCVAVRLRDALPEAEALRQVDHPNLIRVHAVHRFRRSSVLVLDLAAGGSLAELLARRHRLPPGEVLAALTPVAAALAAVHAADLVHGDVSPANILFGADGLPLLSDLGSAYWLDDPVPTAVPAVGFADPLAERGYLVGQPGDVFSLAAVAFTALTGAKPGTPGAESSLPAALGDIVRAGLAADPSRRPTMARFAAELRFAGPASGVDLHAGRHSALTPLPVITRGARLPAATAGGDRSPSRRLHRWRRAPRDTPRPRPSR